MDIYTAEKFSIKTYEDSVALYNWLEEQTVKFTNLLHALKVYRGQEDAPTATAKPQQRYTKKSFKSRKQLNNFLRRHGYTWRKVAPMGEGEESAYGESWRWELYSSDNRVVTVDEALKEIG
jgi:hypothetical protein